MIDDDAEECESSERLKVCPCAMRDLRTGEKVDAHARSLISSFYERTGVEDTVRCGECYRENKVNKKD